MTRPHDPVMASPALSQGTVTGESAFGWVLGAGVLLVLLVLSMVRLVAGHQRLVVVRFGRVVAVKDSGLVVVLPVDRTTRVSVAPTRLDLLWLDAVTADGVAVTISGAAIATVRDPVAYVRAAESGEAATEEAATTVIRAYVAGYGLAALSQPSETTLRELAVDISGRARDWGVEVTQVEFAHMEVQVQPGLIQWVDGLAGTGAWLGVERSACAPDRNGGPSAMEIIRTTVPGTGTLYHCHTAGGQHLGVLVDDADRRRLLVYGSADLDVPTQTIVMNADEADQVADILHSRAIADRLAALERRFAESTGEPR